MIALYRDVVALGAPSSRVTRAQFRREVRPPAPTTVLGYISPDVIGLEKPTGYEEPGTVPGWPRREITPAPVVTAVSVAPPGTTPGPITRGIFKRGTANTDAAEASAVVREMNTRNIFAQGQAEKVSPSEALKWGVDVSLYHFAPHYRTGFDPSRPYAGTIRYPTPQYLSDDHFINHVRAAIGAARSAVGQGKSSTVKDPRWGGHRARSSAQMPETYKDVIRAAMGL